MNKNLDELLLYEGPVPVIVQGGEYLLCSLRGLLLSVPLKTGGQWSRGFYRLLFNFYIKRRSGCWEVGGLGVYVGSSSTIT